jgi:hypothetical protein
MKTEKKFKIKGVVIYIQYFFYHFGIAIDYERYVKQHNVSILLPFVIIAFEIPARK